MTWAHELNTVSGLFFSWLIIWWRLNFLSLSMIRWWISVWLLSLNSLSLGSVSWQRMSQECLGTMNGNARFGNIINRSIEDWICDNFVVRIIILLDDIKSRDWKKAATELSTEMRTHAPCRTVSYNTLLSILEHQSKGARWCSVDDVYVWWTIPHHLRGRPRWQVWHGMVLDSTLARPKPLNESCSDHGYASGQIAVKPEFGIVP